MIGPYQGISRFLDDTVIAGKTGGTAAAKNTLVTAAERGGMTLIIVTMRTARVETAVPLFPDTAMLLDYASENFTKVNVASNESSFSVNNTGFFHTGSAIFGQPQPLIEINKNDYIVLPKDIPFSDASPELTFQNEESPDVIATLSYTWNGQPVGSASIQLAQSNVQEFTFDRETGDSEEGEEEVSDENAPKKFIRINIRLILTCILLAAAVFLLCLLLRYLMKRFNVMENLRRLQRRKRRKRSRKRRRRKIAKNRQRRTSKNRNSPYSDLDL